MKRKRLPKLCLHKHTGQYYVRLAGRQHYLGADEAQAEKERLRLLQGEPAVRGSAAPTINDLILAYVGHADRRYRNTATGEPTSEPRSIRHALRPLQRLFGGELIEQFGTRHLLRVQEAMTDGSWMTEADRAKAGHRAKDGWCRRTCNAHLERILRCFDRGVLEELVPAALASALRKVPRLEEGRSAVRETGDVPPADEASVAAVLAVASPIVAALVRVQLLTGARPGEACRMRVRDIDRSGEALSRLVGAPVAVGKCWACLPGAEERRGKLRTDHKTAHHAHERIIPLGPQVQAILAPLLLGKAPDEYLFVASKRRRYYSRGAYQNAIARTLARVNAERAKEGLTQLAYFHPHQLRHNAGTRLERQFGERIAQLVLGHSSPKATRVYVARDVEAMLRAIESAG